MADYNFWMMIGQIGCSALTIGAAIHVIVLDKKLEKLVTHINGNAVRLNKLNSVVGDKLDFIMQNGIGFDEDNNQRRLKDI